MRLVPISRVPDGASLGRDVFVGRPDGLPCRTCLPSSRPSTSERVYAPAESAHAGVRVIREGSGQGFDPYIVGVFSRLVAPFPPGVEVELDDGRRAIVVSVPQADLDRPTVRVLFGPDAPCDIDLLREPCLGIAGWNPTHARAAA